MWVSCARSLAAGSKMRCASILRDRPKPSRRPRGPWAAISPSSIRPGPGSKRRQRRAKPRSSVSASTGRRSRRGAGLASATARPPAAFHAGEILYVFDNLPAFPWLISEEDRALAEIASSYWVNFVKTGDPNGPNLPPWPSFRSGAIMRLDATASAVAEDGRDRQIFLRDVAAAQEPGADGASSSRTS